MSGEQATIQVWLEVVEGAEGPEIHMSPVSKEHWATIKRDIYRTHGVRLEENQQQLVWSGITAKLLYGTFTAGQKGRIESSFELDLGKNAGKIIVLRSYRDVLCNYEEQFT